MLNLFKKHVKIQPVIYWTDGEIPAKTFFKVMLEGRYDLMGTAPLEQLEAAYDHIYDEYVEIEDNQQVLNWFKKRESIARNAAKIEVIELILYNICFEELTTDERLDFIEKLNSIEDKPATDFSPARYLVKFDINKPLLDEIKRVQKVVLGSLRNRINAEMTTEKKQAESIKYRFEDDLVDVENVLGRNNVDTDITLYKFLSLKKSARVKVNAQRKKN